MKITMRLNLPLAHPIRFYDACKAASEVLLRLAIEAADTGDIDHFPVVQKIALPEDGEEIGTLTIIP